MNSFVAIDCSYNQISSLQFNSCPNIASLDCSNNQLASLQLPMQLSGLQSINCSGNQLTQLKIHGYQQLGLIDCSNNLLTNLEIRNLPLETYANINFSSNPSLQTICADALATETIGEKLITYGMTGITITDECNYSAPACVPGTICFNEAYLKFSMISNPAIDSNSDGEIQISEAQATSSLTIAGPTFSLFGLQYFTNLTQLTVAYTQVGGIYDFSAFANLTSLEVSGNYGVDQINIDGLSNLVSLKIHDNNEVSSINASGLTALTTLDCTSNNNLYTLTLPGAGNLLTAHCENNMLTSLNLSSSANLTTLDASQNQLHTVSLAAAANLSSLDLWQNKLANLSLTPLTGLQHLNISNNLFTVLDLTGLNALSTIDCSRNKLFMLNAALPSLTDLNCSENVLLSDLFLKNDNATADLLTLNLMGNYSLVHICADAVDFPIVQNSINAELLNGVTIDANCSCAGSCEDTIVFIPDATFKGKLLSASATNYIARNLTGNYGVVDSNADGEIQRSEAAQILSIDVDQAYTIASLEGISSFVRLNNLSCTYNNITSIDLSRNSQLTFLDCNINDITSLNISGLRKIQMLFCGVNPITSLDVSGLEQLTNLDIGGTPMTTLLMKNGSDEIMFNMSGTSSLSYICADETQLASIEAKLLAEGNTSCVVNSYCSFTPGGLFYTIHGESRYDLDNNGCTDDDLVFRNMKINVSNEFNTNVIIANSFAEYTYHAKAGLHEVVPVLENPEYFVVSPSGTNVEFPATASPLVHDFCIRANGTHPDLEIAVIPLNDAIPGFEARYKIIYKNKGTMQQSGTVHFFFNPVASEFVSAQPAQNNLLEGNLTWNFTNLLPFEQRSIVVTILLNTPTDLNWPLNDQDILTYYAGLNTAATDDSPQDNLFTLSQTVFNSMDPNDKTCLQGTIVTPEIAGQYVHYKIRFENTGSFPAQNIVVKDLIDLEKFEISTLLPIDGSHEFVTRITQGNKVEFIFENIQLPFDDANNDGYLVFKIKTKSTLVAGDSFSNSASIYFDYNFPVITGTAITEIELLSTPDFNFSDKFILYPNPASQHIMIRSTGVSQPKKVEIYSTTGQLLIAVTNATDFIDISGLPTGTYLVKTISDQAFGVTQFIKQ